MSEVPGFLGEYYTFYSPFHARLRIKTKDGIVHGAVKADEFYFCGCRDRAVWEAEETEEPVTCLFCMTL